MPSQVVSLRLDEETIGRLDLQAGELTGGSRSKLVRDALVALEAIGVVGATRANDYMREIGRRYGSDAVLTIFVEGEPGEEDAVALINGEAREDVQAHLAIHPADGLAHLFIEVPDFTPPTGYGTIKLGSAVMVTLPTGSVGSLPWPTPPNTGLVARLDRWVTYGMGEDIAPPATTNHRA